MNSEFTDRLVSNSPRDSMWFVRYSWANNPWILFIIAFVFAMIYTLFPTNTTNTDVSNDSYILLVRSCWWDITGVIATVELLCISLPGIDDVSYVYCYALGYIIAPLINVISYSCEIHNVYIATVSITASTIVPSLIFCVYMWRMFGKYQNMQHNLRLKSNKRLRMRLNTRIRASNDGMAMNESDRKVITADGNADGIAITRQIIGDMTANEGGINTANTPNAKSDIIGDSSSNDCTNDDIGDEDELEEIGGHWPIDIRMTIANNNNNPSDSGNSRSNSYASVGNNIPYDLFTSSVVFDDVDLGDLSSVEDNPNSSNVIPNHNSDTSVSTPAKARDTGDYNESTIVNSSTGYKTWFSWRQSVVAPSSQLRRNRQNIRKDDDNRGNGGNIDCVDGMGSDNVVNPMRRNDRNDNSASNDDVSRRMLSDNIGTIINNPSIGNASSSQRLERFDIESPSILSTSSSIPSRQDSAMNEGGSVVKSISKHSKQLIQAASSLLGTFCSVNNDLMSKQNQKTEERALLVRVFGFLPRFVLKDMHENFNFNGNNDRISVRRGQEPVLTGNPLFQFCLAILFLVLYNGYYDSLCLFTYYFRAHSGAQIRFGLFFVFIVMGLGFRLLLKRVGLAIDRRKRGTASMYFVGELMALFFYYTFYRVLFESVSSWYLFFLFQVLHVVSEWVTYPLRGSSTVFKLFESWEHRWPLLLKGVLLPADLSENDFQGFLCLDFAIRCVVMVCASIGILFLLLVIDYCDWIQSNLKQTGVARTNTMLLIIISVAIEAINAIAINYYFFVPLKMRLISKVKQCFQARSFALVTVAIAANLYINPIFALSKEK